MASNTESRRIIDEYLGQSRTSPSVDSSNSRLGDSPSATDSDPDGMALWNSVNTESSPSTPEPSTPSTPDNSPSLLADTGRKFLAGIPRLGGAVVSAGQSLGLVPDQMANKIQLEGAASSEKIRSHISDKYSSEFNKQLIDDKGEYGGYSATTLLGDVAESLPDLIATIGPAGGLKKLGQAVGLAKNSKLAGVISAGLVEGGIAGAESGSASRVEVLQKTPDELQKSTRYLELLSSAPEGTDKATWAKEQLANEVADDIGGKTALSTGAIGAVTGGGAIGSLLNRGVGKVSSSLISRMGKDAAKEMFQEFNQSGAEQLIRNQSMKELVNPDQDLMEGVLDASFRGAAAGGVLGGGMGVFGSGKSTDPVPSENVNPLTGEKLQNKEVTKTYNKFIDVFKNTQDTTLPAYQEGLQVTQDNLNAFLAKENLSPIDRKEAEDVLSLINKAHTSLLQEEQTNAEKEKKATEAVTSAVSEEAPAVTPIDSPESPVAPTVRETPANLEGPRPLVKTEESSSIPEPVETPPAEVTSKEIPAILKTRTQTNKRQRYDKLVANRQDAEIKRLENDLAQANSELRTNPVTEIPNKRAFLEKDLAPFVASIDVDSLKFINDTLGHEGGDALLKHTAQVLSKYIDVAHVSGDELWARGSSKEELDAGLKKAREELANGNYTINVDQDTISKRIKGLEEDLVLAQKEGNQEAIDSITNTLSVAKENQYASFNKPSFSYGIADTLPSDDKTFSIKSAIKQADLTMLDQKAAREKAGERAARGEAPAGFVKDARNNTQSLTPAESSVEGKASTANVAGEEATLAEQEETVDEEQDDVIWTSVDLNLNEEEINAVEELNSLYNELSSDITFARESGAPKEVLRSLTEKRVSIAKRKAALNGKILSTPVYVKPENNDFGDETLVTEDSLTEFHLEDLTPSTSLTPPNHVKNKTILDRLVLNLSDSIKSNSHIEYVEDFGTYSWKDSVYKSGVTPEEATKAKAFFHVKGGKNYIFFNGKNLRTPEDIVGTFAHEIIGHYGLRNIFSTPSDLQTNGRSGYDNFLLNLVNDNPKLREDILALNNKWQGYLNHWNKTRSIDNLSLDQTQLWKDSSGKAVEIPAEIAIKLADEYMAELAKAKFLSRKFLTEQVGLGARASQERSAIRKQRDIWFNSFIKKIKHYARKIFGNYTNNLTIEDLEQSIAKSIDNSFEILNPDSFLKIESGLGVEPSTRPILSRKKPIGPSKIVADPVSLDPTPLFDNDVEAQALSDSSIVNQMELSPIKDIDSFIQGINSSFGNHKDTLRSKFTESFNNKVLSNPILNAFKTFGNMTNQKAYTAINSVFKGKIAAVEQSTVSFASALKGLNALQNQAVFEYFTTAGADPLVLPVTPIQRTAIIRAKNSIRELGKSLADMGAISKESYAENEDAYLHTVYLKYVDQYRGSGKKTSLLSWAMKKKKFSPREKLALGQIKDVKFLVPETFGILARDHMLLKMFGTINQASINNDLHWVMNSNLKIRYGKHLYDIDEAMEQLERNQFILDELTRRQTNTFSATPKQIKTLTKMTAELKAEVDRLDSLTLSKAFKAFNKRDASSPEEEQEFLRAHYTKLSGKKTLGALSGKWIRKEIASDLEAYTAAFDLHDKNIIDKFFSRGGTLDKFHQFWKMSMVGLNPGSWARNTLGNFSLLDLSTSTNKGKLITMLFDEILSNSSGNPSEYWGYAKDHGLFGTTWAANELQDIFTKYGKEIKTAQEEHLSWNRSALDHQLPFLDPRLNVIGQIMKGLSEAKEQGVMKVSSAHSLLEGTFKTVALRDYVNIWEEQNKVEFPDGLKSLDESQKQVVLTKAAQHANDAIFDYSQVPSMVRSLRRVPFGSPFLTFSYKAFPASVRAMVNHPIKFAQYAGLPVLLTMLAQVANDWDDDDINKYRRMLPDYYRLNEGVAFFPFKDSLGRVQVIDLGYLIPWNQYTTAAKKIAFNFQEDSFQHPVSMGIKSIGTAVNEFGFMGGPAPSTISAMLTGKDDFTGRDIIPTGSSPSEQIFHSMKFGWDMAVPAWLSSHGWFSKMHQAFGNRPDKNAFGDVKFTPGQAVADITGFRTASVNPSGIEGRRKGYEKKLKDLAVIRSKTIKDRNLSGAEKPSKLKDIATREKLLRARMIKELQG